MSNLLTKAQSNPKTAKNGEDYEATILHLAPADVAGVGNVCPWASEGCKAACLNTAGRGQMSNVQMARERKTRQFFADQEQFLRQLDRELSALERRAERKGKRAVVRLNGTSDIPWETLRFKKDEADGIPARSLIEHHPGITFYDYTKSDRRALCAVKDPDWPSNYTLTLSRSEVWDAGDVRRATDFGANVAVVFRGPELPDTYEGARVIDGTTDDWRFEDPRGVVVGLLPKGKAKRDTSGFVVDV